MKKIFHLSESNLELAKEEVLSLTGAKKYLIIEDLLICSNLKELELKKRLGYTHAIYKFLFNCNRSSLKNKVNSYNWQSLYNTNFCVRVHGKNNNIEKEIAFLIYNKLKNPKVNLKKPKTKIEFFIKEKKVFAGLFLEEVDKSYMKRRAHLRPRLHPTSLHPKLAKACINLSGLKKGVILDPFCGSGGILIEAGLMGFKIIGYDIDEEQVNRARINLSHYKINKYKVEMRDALELTKKNILEADAIITDFPYGKGSKGKNLFFLYQQFLANCYNYIDKMIIIFPDFIDYNKIIEKTRWKIKKKFSIYMHKSLTRILIKLSKK